jgi:hypothetical protein
MSREEKEQSESVAVEKQKTIRLSLIIVATFLLAVVGLYIMAKSSGPSKMDVDLSKGKFSLSLDKPIVDQGGIRTSTAKANGADIQVTEGLITDPALIGQLNSIKPSAPTQFSGKNFINHEQRFLLSAPHPELWQVSYNALGLQNPNVPINSIFNPEGSHLNIWREQVPAGTTIEQYVSFKIQQMSLAGLISQQPLVTYDLPSRTAFLVFTNPATMGQSYIKAILDLSRNAVFGATANYNQALSSPQALQDLVTMVRTFTLY